MNGRFNNRRKLQNIMNLFISTLYYLNFNPNINNPKYICTNSYEIFIIAILVLLSIIQILLNGLPKIRNYFKYY